MNASKEEATKALLALVKLSDAIPPGVRTQNAGQIICIEEFLEAAKRKLPSEAAFDRAKAKSK